MATTVTISGIEYSLPSQGDNAPWGDQLNSILDALIEVANNSIGTGEITPSSFSMSNNQSSAANITGLSFNIAVVRGFWAEFTLYRKLTNSSNVITEEYAECGTIHGVYKTNAATWQLAVTGVGIGDAGITFSITSAGQLQYVSSNLTIPASGSHTCTLKFRSRALLQ